MCSKMMFNVLMTIIIIATNLVKGSVYSPYPCVWIDNETNETLDLQIFKEYILFYFYYDYPIYYTPCINNLNGTDGSSMSIVKLNQYMNQTLSKWNNGVIAPQLIEDQWKFYYSNPNIECVANHSDTVNFNLTFHTTSGPSSPVYPTMTYAYAQYNSDKCHVRAIITGRLLQNDDCAINFGTVNINLSVFRNYIFEYFIDLQRVIMYTPCNGLFVCNNLLTQAIIKNTSSNEECETYLALYVNTVQVYVNTVLVYKTIYYD
eukprot:71341_1